MSNKENPHKILEAMRSNVAKRDTCARHKFNPDDYAPAKNMECSACGCKVPLHYIHPYISGYAAAGGDPNDIWQDWQGSPQRASATGG